MHATCFQHPFKAYQHAPLMLTPSQNSTEISTYLPAVLDFAMVILRITGGEISPQITIVPSAKVRDLKERILQSLDVEISRQTLMYEGRELFDDEEIQDCINSPVSATLVLSVAPSAEDRKISVWLDSSIKQAFIRVRESAMVADLRDKIERKWGLSGCIITLCRLNTEMFRHLPLSAYYVHEGSKVEVRVTVLEEGR